MAPKSRRRAPTAAPRSPRNRHPARRIRYSAAAAPNQVQTCPNEAGRGEDGRSEDGGHSPRPSFRCSWRRAAFRRSRRYPNALARRYAPEPSWWVFVNHNGSRTDWGFRQPGNSKQFIKQRRNQRSFCVFGWRGKVLGNVRGTRETRGILGASGNAAWARCPNAIPRSAAAASWLGRSFREARRSGREVESRERGNGGLIAGPPAVRGGPISLSVTCYRRQHDPDANVSAVESA